jgi:hypothetical protein
LPAVGQEIKRPTGKRGKHRTQNTNFLLVSKTSAVTDIMNALPEE